MSRIFDALTIAQDEAMDRVGSSILHAGVERFGSVAGRRLRAMSISSAR
jgi:hypothetical protein